MNLLSIAEVIGSVLLGFGGFIAGLGYAWGQYNQGKNQATLDEGNTKLNTNSLLKEQIDALESKVNQQSSEIKDLTEQVHKLRDENALERQKFAEAIIALQGADPTWQKFIADANHYMTFSMPVLDRIGKFLDKQSF